jgi:hypothetical protein
VKKIAISQSNYIPWKGYFDLINRVDEFILYDDVQYTRRDWRNRNKIKTYTGTQWLTIHVDVKGKYFQKINETKINDKYWPVKHWQQIKHNYAKAQNFKKYKDIFEELYLSCKEEYLSEINHKFIIAINQILGIKTKIRFSSEFKIPGDQTEKLINICKQCNATVYISGPAAKSYLDEQLANKENILVEWMNYENYKEYEQLYPPFEHGVTILDLIFNTDSTNFMKCFTQ